MTASLRCEAADAPNREQLLGCATWLTPPSRKPARTCAALRLTSSAPRVSATGPVRLGARASSERRRQGFRYAISATRLACISVESPKSCEANSSRRGTPTELLGFRQPKKAATRCALTQAGRLTTRSVHSSWLIRTLRVAAL